MVDNCGGYDCVLPSSVSCSLPPGSTCSAQAPAAFTLQSPPNNSEFSYALPPSTITLRWNATSSFGRSSDQTTNCAPVPNYTLCIRSELSSTCNIRNSVLASSVTSSTFTPSTSDAGYNPSTGIGTYYWKVTATNGSNWTTTTPERKFTVDLRPRYTITGRLCFTDETSSNCSATSACLSSDLTQIFAGIMSLSGGTNPNISSATPLTQAILGSNNVSHTFTSNSIAGFNGPYVLQLSQNPTSYFFIHNNSISINPVTENTTQNFCVTLQNDPWWQTKYGDVFAENDIVSPIPPNPSSGPYFSISDATKSPGIPVFGGDNINLSNGIISQTVNWYAENTESRTIQGGTQPYNWFGYFKRTYEIVQQTSTTFSVLDGEPLLLDQDDLDPDYEVSNNRITQDDNYTDEHLYYHNGNVTISNPISIPAGEKHTIFIDGDLTINTPTITAPPGSFLGFIISGNITFGPDTRNVAGFYVANGTLTIEDAPGSADTGLGRQFNGSGIFVGQSGVNLDRDLKSPSQQLANNLNPAELFTYRPDFAANAPRGLKRIPVRWREIEPQSIDGL